jgi:heptosyltransferase-3
MRILVIRGGAIGDFILTLPAIRLLRESFPGVHLEVLGYQHIVSLAVRGGLVDAARSIEYAGMAGFFVPNGRLEPELADYFSSFHQVISYLYDPDGFFAGNLARCGAKNLINGDPRIDGSVHAADQLAKPMQQLALFLEKTHAELEITAEDRAFAESFLRDARRPLIAIHPGSGGETKNWPLQNWREIGEWLFTSVPNCNILLIGGEADLQNVAELKRNWSRPSLHLVENFPLPQLGALLQRADLFLGHDSGISHLAAAVGARSLLLFGPTVPAIWAPTNPGVKIISSPSSRMEDISPASVKDRIMELLRVVGR